MYEAKDRLGIIITTKTDVAGKFLGFEWELPRDANGDYITCEPVNDQFDDCADAKVPKLLPDDAGEPVDGEAQL